MSSFINKAKDKIEATLNKDKSDNPQSDNFDSYDSNPSGRNQGRVGGPDSTQRYDDSNLGTGDVDSSRAYGSSTNDPSYDNPQSTNAGPHSSNLMNKLDPRADSDRDHRNDPTSRVGGVGNTQQYDDVNRSTGIGGVGGTDTGYGGDDFDQSRGTGTMGTTRTGYSGASQGGPIGGFGGRDTNTRGDDFQQGGGLSQTTGGFDDSNIGSRGTGLQRDDEFSQNRGGLSQTTGGFDDSTVGGRNTGYQQTGFQQDDGFSQNRGGLAASTTTGVTGGGYSDTSGGYDAQTTDYNQRSGMGRSTGSGMSSGYDDSSYTPGSGTADKTAGPHNSNIMNKLDPRVDSDMDGSKTYGGEATRR